MSCVCNSVSYNVAQLYSNVKITLKCDIIILKVSGEGAGPHRTPAAAAANDQKLSRGNTRRHEKENNEIKPPRGHPWSPVRPCYTSSPHKKYLPESKNICWIGPRYIHHQRPATIQRPRPPQGPVLCRMATLALLPAQNLLSVVSIAPFWFPVWSLSLAGKQSQFAVDNFYYLYERKEWMRKTQFYNLIKTLLLVAGVCWRCLHSLSAAGKPRLERNCTCKVAPALIIVIITFI